MSLSWRLGKAVTFVNKQHIIANVGSEHCDRQGLIREEDCAKQMKGVQGAQHPGGGDYCRGAV
jgi:hypothetical protein